MLINDEKKNDREGKNGVVMPSRTWRRLPSVIYVKHDFLKLSLCLLDSG